MGVVVDPTQAPSHLSRRPLKYLRNLLGFDFSSQLTLLVEGKGGRRERERGERERKRRERERKGGREGREREAVFLGCILREAELGLQKDPSMLTVYFLFTN